MTNEEATNDPMETYPTQAYGSSERDEPDYKENVVLRTLAGDSERYVPIAEHRLPSTMPGQAPQPVAMYTLGTPYQPIPLRHLPKKTDPKVYYVGSRQTEEVPTIKQDRESPPMYRSEQQSDEPVIFLQPQVIPQPILYNIAGQRSTPAPREPTPRSREPPSPVLYSLNGRPRTMNMGTNTVEDATPVVAKVPTLYSWVGNSPLQNEVPEPTKHHLQPAPQVYAVVGSPARTSRGVQASTSSPVHPAPVLYTIVGDTPIATNRPKEHHSPPSARNTVMYNLDNEVDVRQQQQQQQQQPLLTPTLYALVGRQLPPPAEEIRTKPPARNRTPPPPPVTVVTHRMSRSVERKPDVITEEFVSYPTIKPHRQPQPKEPAGPKPELFIIPANDEERRHRPPRSRQLPLPAHAHTEQPVRKSNAVAQYPSVQSSDYHSSHTNRTRKPYREQKPTNTLPAIGNHRPERKERPPLYEPRYRVERHHPYVATNPISFERYPVNTKPRASLWDHGYQTQTDDDEDYEQRLDRKNRIYKTPRPRAPWIPVW